MRRVFLPTLDDPASPGGVARYIQAIGRTFPEDVQVVDLGRPFPVRKEMMERLREGTKHNEQIWTHHIFPVGTCAMLHRFRSGTPYTVFLHGMDFDQSRRTLWRSLLARMVLRMAKRVVVNSEALGREVYTLSGVQPLVVYPCVEDALIEAARHPAIGHNGSPTFLTVGRLVERKGHLKVLDALKNIPNAGYLIVGDGPLREQILDRVKELDLSSRVEVRTQVRNEDLPDVYRSADIFIMPSSKSRTDREGFGIVYLEAGLFEIPSIAVCQPGVDEAVLHDQTGLLIEDTSSDLLGAMQKLATDEDMRKRLGAAAKERVLAEFTREKQMEKLRKIL